MTVTGIVVLVGMIVVLIGMIVLAVVGRYLPPAISEHTTATFPENARGRVRGTLRLLDDAPLVAPLTGRPCTYYEAVVEERKGQTEWHVLIHEHQGQDFLLEDDDGTARVIMQDARVALVEDAHFRSGILVDSTPVLEAFLAKHGVSGKSLLFDKNLRYREGVLEAGDFVAVYGHGSREPDPDPRAANGGYREGVTRLVLSSRPSMPLRVTDDSGERTEALMTETRRARVPPGAR